MFDLFIKVHHPWIVCKDGVTLSVQVGDSLYCTPRQNEGPYTHMEVGFPSVIPPDSWREYCEDWDNPTDTVYCYIPVELIQEFIDAHGGMDIAKTITKALGYNRSTNR